MDPVRTRTCAAGAALAVTAGALVDHGAVFGADFPRAALLGLALGAALALVPHRSAVERLGGFAVGLGAAWVGYLLRAGVLPDIPMGRAIAAVVVVSLVTAAATATADRLPLWAGLAGAGTFVGAYEAAYAAAPGEVVAGSTVALTSVLLAAAFGFLVGNLVPGLVPARTGAARAAADDNADESADASPVSLEKTSTASVPGPRAATDVPVTTSRESDR